MTGPGADDPDRADDDPREPDDPLEPDDAAHDRDEDGNRERAAEDATGRDAAPPPSDADGPASDGDVASASAADVGGEKDEAVGAERDGTGTDGTGTDGTEGPEASADGEEEDAVSPGEVGYARWLLRTNEPGVVFLRDVVSSVGTVVLIGLVLFAVSGLWPPLVAVESGSMEPHMYKGDLVFVMDEQRFPPDQAAANTGVVTYRGAMQVDANDDSKRGYRSFGEYGNVVVYERDGTDGKPIIHRAMLFVEEGEEWVDRANQSHLGGATTCEEVYSCPAPYDGFITKGDANQYYDQSNRMRLSGVVKPEWIKGRAKARVPWLGHVRLLFGAAGASGTGGDAVASTTHGPVGHPAPASSVALAAAGQSSTGNGGVSSPAVGAVDASWNELPIPNHAIAVGATGLAFATRRLRRRTAA